MKQAIEKAGTLNSKKLQEVLLKEEFKCVLFNRVKYESKGDYTNINKYASVGLLQWQNGQLVNVYPPDVAEAPFMYPMPWKGR